MCRRVASDYDVDLSIPILTVAETQKKVDRLLDHVQCRPTYINF